jgi:hypothetical protein
VGLKFWGILKFLCFLGAISSFPLYLLSYGLRFAPAATQKDAVAIWARVFVDSSIFLNLIELYLPFWKDRNNKNSKPFDCFALRVTLVNYFD